MTEYNQSEKRCCLKAHCTEQTCASESQRHEGVPEGCVSFGVFSFNQQAMFSDSGNIVRQG